MAVDTAVFVALTALVKVGADVCVIVGRGVLVFVGVDPAGTVAVGVGRLETTVVPPPKLSRMEPLPPQESSPKYPPLAWSAQPAAMLYQMASLR